jgi:hypothetical protein
MIVVLQVVHVGQENILTKEVVDVNASQVFVIVDFNLITIFVNV